MATLAMPKGSPRAERASCVWMASSRVGATTRVVILEDEVLVDELMSALRAGIPNAKVFPLPVSAIPTTSFPARAGGHVHAWMGEGSLKVLNASVNPFGSDDSWPNDTTGDTGVGSASGTVIVMLCFFMNSSASLGEVGATDALAGDAPSDEEDEACADAEDDEACFSSFLRFFLSFFEPDSGSPPSASASFRFRFLSFLDSFVADSAACADFDDSAGVDSGRR